MRAQLYALNIYSALKIIAIYFKTERVTLGRWMLSKKRLILNILVCGLVLTLQGLLRTMEEISCKIEWDYLPISTSPEEKPQISTSVTGTCRNESDSQFISLLRSVTSFERIFYWWVHCKRNVSSGLNSNDSPLCPHYLHHRALCPPLCPPLSFLPTLALFSPSSSTFSSCHLFVP